MSKLDDNELKKYTYLTCTATVSTCAPTNPSNNTSNSTGSSPSTTPIPTSSNTTAPAANATSPPPPSYNVTTAPHNITNTTAYPIGTTINPKGCPTINSTLFRDNTTVPIQQVYQLQCYRYYSGPNYQSLPETNFRSCIAACDSINGGGSASNGGVEGKFCYGVTWLKVRPLFLSPISPLPRPSCNSPPPNFWYSRLIFDVVSTLPYPTPLLPQDLTGSRELSDGHRGRECRAAYREHRTGAGDVLRYSKNGEYLYLYCTVSGSVK